MSAKDPSPPQISSVFHWFNAFYNSRINRLIQSLLVQFFEPISPPLSALNDDWDHLYPQMTEIISTLITRAESEDLCWMNFSLSLSTVSLLSAYSQCFQTTLSHCLSEFTIYFNSFPAYYSVSNHGGTHIGTLHYRFPDCFGISSLKNSYDLVFSIHLFQAFWYPHYSVSAFWLLMTEIQPTVSTLTANIKPFPPYLRVSWYILTQQQWHRQHLQQRLTLLNLTSWQYSLKFWQLPWCQYHIKLTLTLLISRLINIQKQHTK